MRLMKIFIHVLLIITTPTLFAYPQIEHVHSRLKKNIRKPDRYHTVTYDQIISLLHALETGQNDFREKDYETINDFLTYLARQGVLPNTPTALALEKDIHYLLCDNTLEYAYVCDDWTILPALSYHSYDTTFCKSHAKKNWEKAKAFVKRNKKAIIIGAVVVVAAVTVVAAIVVVSSATAVAAAGAAGAAIAQSAPSIELNEAPKLRAELDLQATNFKHTIQTEGHFETFSLDSLSLEETGRALGPLLAHHSLTTIQNKMETDPYLLQEINQLRHTHNSTFSPYDINYAKINQGFSSDYTRNPLNDHTNFNALTHEVVGERALALGHYNQALEGLGRAIELNPTNPLPYLQRSNTYFNMGQYDKAFHDFENFSIQMSHIPQTYPFSLTDFVVGFAKGVPQGAYESSAGMLLFLADFSRHPIQTSTQMIQAIGLLAKLACTNEWATIASGLAPEICELVTKWDTIPSERRGELAGYSLAKHGADFLTPAVIAKIAARSAQIARELNTIARSLNLAHETLILETAAEIGNSAKVAELIQSGQKMSFLGEELGFTAKEMGQLKHAGKLESAITQASEHLTPSMQESIALFRKAQDFLKPYRKKAMPENKIRELIHQTGIPTFPRPKGIPENYLVMISDKGAGMIYVHPKDSGTYVRIMPGKPHSPFPYQHKPYANQRLHGKSVNNQGNFVLNDSLEAHTPLSEFTFKDLN